MKRGHLIKHKAFDVESEVGGVRRGTGIKPNIHTEGATREFSGAGTDIQYPVGNADVRTESFCLKSSGDEIISLKVDIKISVFNPVH